MLEEGAGAEGSGKLVCGVVVLMAGSCLVSDAVGSCVELTGLEEVQQTLITKN